MASNTKLSPAERSLGDLVQEDERAVSVFEGFGLHFCCEGRRTLRQAVEANGLSLEALLTALEDLGPPTAQNGLVPQWDDLRLLVRHVCDQHHAGVRSSVPAINAGLDCLVEHHGTRHLELASVRETFRGLAAELTTHMLKEEHLLFPYIADLEVARQNGSSLPIGPFGTILNPIRVLEADHARMGELSTRLRTLTRNFTVPADACGTYRRCYGELQTFDQNLHRHVHLENHILFPRAIEIERSLM